MIYDFLLKKVQIIFFIFLQEFNAFYYNINYQYFILMKIINYIKYFI